MHPYALAILAILIPVLAWATQVLNYKLMPQAASTGDENGTMQASMKTMNTVMPLMSAVFCFTFPVGLGILLDCQCCCKKSSAGGDQPSS